MLNKKLLGSVSSLPQDDNFENVTLLLNGDGTNGGQNNTFVDSSTNNFTITRNGNTTQGSFSPYGDLWSNIFTTTTSRLTYGSASNWAFLSNGSSDWTIEGWIFYSAANGDIVNTSGGSAQVGMQLYFGSPSAGNLTVYFTNGGGAAGGSSSGSMNANQWNHFAVTFTSSTKVVAYYINGASSGTNSHSGFSFSASNPNFANRVGNSLFGSQGGGANTIISNLRISDTVRTGLTTIPTAPFSSDGNTKLLVCNSNSFADKSSNNYSVSVNSTPSVQRFSPFEPSAPYSTSVIGGSGYFDGSGDYLQIENNNTFDTNSTFTLECWFYQPSAGDACFFGRGGGDASWSASNGHQFLLFISDGTLYWMWNTGGGNSTSINTSAPASGQWHHLAVGYNGTTTRFWLNGTSLGTSTTGYTLPTTRNIIRIGLNPSDQLPLNGYESNLRFVKGTDVYGVGNSTITIPTAPLTAITNTSLLCNMVNASIFDYAMQNDYETAGNAQVSTSVKKFGTGSIYLDGTGDWLAAPATPQTDLGSGDFTIECWLYRTASGAASDSGMVSRGAPSTTNGFVFGYTSSNVLTFNFNYSGAIVTGSTAISVNTWTHVAVTRSGSTFRLFVNGTVDATATSSNSQTTNSSDVFYIGRSGFSSDRIVTGYIDDVRITKGLARYTANFTAPASALPTY